MADPTWAVRGREIVPFSSLLLSPEAGIVQYGLGCFEGVRSYAQEGGGFALFRLDDHLARLRRSAAVLRMQLPGPTAEVAELMVELLRRENIDGTAYLKGLAFKGFSQMGGGLADMSDDFLAYAKPMPSVLGSRKAVDMSLSPWRRVSDNAIPARAKITGAYVNSVLARSQARSMGHADALLLTADGHLAEASGANVFVCRGGKLATPPVYDDILEGISRDTVLSLAAGLGLDVVERRVDSSELYAADEVFVCGTGVELCAVVGVDDYPIGAGEPGPIFAVVEDAFAAAAHGGTPEHKGWLTAI